MGDDPFDFQSWPIMRGATYRAVDPPPELEGLEVRVTHMEGGEITCEDVKSGQTFVWDSANEFRRHHRPTS